MDQSMEETRLRFSATLDELHRGALQLGALVLENTRRTAEAMLENRLDLAAQAVEADDEIDAIYANLERKVFEVMARQQPVAGDLRYLVSLTRILYEIERSGDLAVNAAAGMLANDGYELPPEVHAVLARMTRASSDLFGKGLDAFADLDPDAGAALDIEDDEIDDLLEVLYAAIARASDDLGFDVAVELSRVARYMERVADHGVNIAEHVTFIVTGKFPEDRPVAVRDEGPE